VTVADAWQAGREHLAAHGIDEAAITAEVLLRHSLKISRADLYLTWDRLIDPGAFDRFQAYLDERVHGRPVAYITGHREFMGLDFLVDERVLIPRPETETLVDVVLGVIAGRPAPHIADVGTGCGAIAISLAVARPAASLVAIDNSPDALDVARANAIRHNVAERIRFLLGDLVAPIAAAGDQVDVLACNPPYVSPADLAGLPREIRDFEPTAAVIAPGHAESVHARLIHDAPAVLRPEGWLVMEVGAGQASRVVELLEAAARYASVRTHRDGLGWERVVAARVSSTG
jgi:release factor glutamine methyltransferase